MSFRVEQFLVHVNMNYGGPGSELVWEPDPANPGTRPIAATFSINTTWDWNCLGNPPTVFIGQDKSVTFRYGNFTVPGSGSYASPLLDIFVQVTFEDGVDPEPTSPQVIEMNGVRVTVEEIQ